MNHKQNYIMRKAIRYFRSNMRLAPPKHRIFDRKTANPSVFFFLVLFSAVISKKYFLAPDQNSPKNDPPA